MVDISKEAIETAWEEFEVCSRSSGSIGDLDIYDTDGMGDHGYTLYRISTTQSARIEQLEESLATARNDAIREAAELCGTEARYHMIVAVEQFSKGIKWKYEEWAAIKIGEVRDAINELITKEAP